MDPSQQENTDPPRQNTVVQATGTTIMKSYGFFPNPPHFHGGAVHQCTFTTTGQKLNQHLGNGCMLTTGPRMRCALNAALTLLLKTWIH